MSDASTDCAKDKKPGKISDGRNTLFLLVNVGRVKDLARHDVGIHVGSRAAVLKVSLSSLLGEVGNADRRTTVGDSVRELVDGSGLVLAGEAKLVILSVHGNVLGVFFTKRLDRGNNVLRKTVRLLPHGLGTVVGVAPGAVPIPGDRLGFI